uniref:Protein phosphatase 1 regulatory subunit 12B n=1 Tax=Musca domestica TaxID=7370 RepID=A0A1I8NAM1_MUSDO
MTSLDIRNNSAVMKRAEQLKRWEESDTNQQPPVPRPDRGSRIKFSSGCIFLAACLAGDKEEVLKLLEQGADINTANVDGLTALHQACIDDNLEMVEFLVEQGADINRQDNEGWTPLHATASCGFVSIARYLVEHGADVAAVNSDGDLAVDLAVDIQHLPMIDFMQKMVAEQQIDCAKARQAEQQQMLADAKKWLRSDAAEIDRPHPKTGATALHVAAAKGYTKVLSLLLAGRANVDAQDNDGWTPLHAAAHWGQKEAAQMLLDAMADMDAHNYAGQTCIDVADRKMVKYLEEYRANNKRIKRRPSSQISRISDTIENHMDKTPPKIIRVEVRPDNNKDHPNDDKTSVQKTTNEQPATEDEAPWRRNNVARVRTSNDSPSKNLPDVIDVNKTTTATPNAATTETTDVILRRTQSFENDEKKSPPVSPAVSTTPAYTTNTTNTTASPAAVATPIRSTTQTQPTKVVQNSSQTKDKNTIQSTTTTTNNNNKNNNMNNNNNKSSPDSNNKANQNNTATTTTTTNNNGSTAEAVKPKQSTGNMIKNFFKSFVPPVRDEESETQRKAHAKRVRETRRSTQGVTLDEIKSAEELVKKKNSSMNNNNNNNSSSNELQGNVGKTNEATTTTMTTVMTNTPVVTATIPAATTTSTHDSKPSVEPTKDNKPQTVDDDEDVTTASFTIKAPSAGNRSRPSSLIVTAKTSTTAANEVDQLLENITANAADAEEEVSATFVMPPRKDSRTPTPTSRSQASMEAEEVETTIVIASPRRNVVEKAITDDEKDKQREEQQEAASVGDGPNKIAEDTTNESDKEEEEAGTAEEDEEEDEDEKEEDEVEETESSDNTENTTADDSGGNNEIEDGTAAHKKTEPPPSLQGNKPAVSPQPIRVQSPPSSQRAQSSERIRAAFFSPLPLTSVPTAATTTTTTITTPTLESPVRLRDKRSIFDMDNANSQTLADRLRLEANRYGFDEKRGFYSDTGSSLPPPQMSHENSSERDSSMSPLFGNLGHSSNAGGTAPTGSGYSYNSRRSLDSSSSASLPNSPFHTRDRETGGSENHAHNAGSTTSGTNADRRPSWRLKFDAGSKFKLEDANAGNTYPPTNSTIIPSAPAVIAAANSMSQRRINNVNNAISSSNTSLNSIGRPVSAPPISNLSSGINTTSSNNTTSSATTTATSSSNNQKSDDKTTDNSSTTTNTTSSSGIGSSYSARRASANTSSSASSTTALNSETSSAASAAGTTSSTATSLSNNDDKDNDKENDNRSALATQAVIQRRRKPKRRSTGVVHIDMDELDPEKQDSANDNEEKDKEKESGSENRASRSRAGSTVSVATSTSSATDDKKTRDKTESSGDNIDYKALWEAVKLENEKLRAQLKKKDDEVIQTRATLERFANATNKNSLSEIEKRERRAMERKLSELEEELKLLQKLKNENERLRAENRALTRVVSKLTSSAQSQLSKANNKQ